MSVIPSISRTRRSGFTIAELLISIALTSIILAQSVTMLIASLQLYQNTIADMELSLRTRAVREKILFNLGAGEDGLINACLTGLTIENPNNNGTGKGLIFKPKTSLLNRLALNDDNKLEATRGSETWLTQNMPTFQNEDLFWIDPQDNGKLRVTLDLGISISQKIHSQQQQLIVQIMNE